MKFRFGHFRGLRRRYGHSGGKRSEGVHVTREKGRLYYVAGNGDVMSAPQRRR